MLNKTLTFPALLAGLLIAHVAGAACPTPVVTCEMDPDGLVMSWPSGQIRVGVLGAAWSEVSEDRFEVTGGILEFHTASGTVVPIPVMQATASCEGERPVIHVGSDVTELPFIQDGFQWIDDAIETIGLDATISLPKFQLVFAQGGALKTAGFRGPINECRYYLSAQLDTKAGATIEEGVVTLNASLEPISVTWLLDPMDPAVYVGAQSSMAGEIGLPISKIGFGASWNGTLAFNSAIPMWRPEYGAERYTQSIEVNVFQNVKANLLPIPGFPVKLLMDAEVGMGIGGSLPEVGRQVVGGLRNAQDGETIDLQSVRGTLGAFFQQLRLGYNMNSLDIKVGPLAVTVASAAVVVKDGKLFVEGDLGFEGAEEVEFDQVESYCSGDRSGLARHIMTATGTLGYTLKNRFSLFVDLMPGHIEMRDGQKVYVDDGERDFGIRTSFVVTGMDCSPLSGLGMVVDVAITKDGITVYDVSGQAQKPSCSLANLREDLQEAFAIAGDAYCAATAESCEDGSIHDRCDGLDAEPTVCLESCRAELCADLTFGKRLCEKVACSIRCGGERFASNVCRFGAASTCHITSQVCPGREPLCEPAGQNDDGSYDLTPLPGPVGQSTGNQGGGQQDNYVPTPSPQPPKCPSANDGQSAYKVCTEDFTRLLRAGQADNVCRIFSGGRLARVTDTNLATLLALTGGERFHVASVAPGQCTQLTANGTESGDCSAELPYLCEVPLSAGCDGMRTITHGARRLAFCPEAVQPGQAASVCEVALAGGRLANLDTESANQAAGQVADGASAWFDLAATARYGDAAWGAFARGGFGTAPTSSYTNWAAGFIAAPPAREEANAGGSTGGWGNSGGAVNGWAQPPSADWEGGITTRAYRQSNGKWGHSDAQAVCGVEGWAPAELLDEVTPRGVLCEAPRVDSALELDDSLYHVSEQNFGSREAAAAYCDAIPGSWQLSAVSDARGAAFFASLMSMDQAFHTASGSCGRLTAFGPVQDCGRAAQALCVRTGNW